MNKKKELEKINKCNEKIRLCLSSQTSAGFNVKDCEGCSVKVCPIMQDITRT